MSLLALVAFSSVAFQGAAAPAAAPDRSGEPVLRQILTWAKGLDNTHVIILKETRERAGAPLYPESRVDFWLAGAKFRLETSGYWGDGLLVASDGVSVLSDSNSEYEAAIVADAKGSPIATLTDLKVTVDEMSPLFGFMAGPEALDKIVEKTAPIKLVSDTDGEKAVSFDSKKLGTVTLIYHERKGGVALDRIDFDNRFWLEEQYKLYPDWWDPPQPGALTRNRIVVLEAKSPNSLFGTKPPKGRAFEDKRKKRG